MPRKAQLLISIAIGAAILLGCEILFIPPFDTTGTYFGAWSNNNQSLNCPLMLELEQTNTDNPLDPPLITGKIDLDLSCLGDIFTLLDLVGVLHLLNLPLEGALFFDGALELHSTNIDETCELGICTEVAFLGTGLDKNEDGFMETYDGTWAIFFRISQNDSDLRDLLEELGLEGLTELPIPELLNFAFDARTKVTA